MLNQKVLMIMKLFEVKRKINTSIANFNLADSIENLTEII